VRLSKAKHPVAGSEGIDQTTQPLKKRTPQRRRKRREARSRKTADVNRCSVFTPSKISKIVGVTRTQTPDPPLLQQKSQKLWEYIDGLSTM